MKSRKEYLFVMGTGLVLGMLGLLLPIIQGGGIFTLRGDFNAQEIPFLMIAYSLPSIRSVG